MNKYERKQQHEVVIYSHRFSRTHTHSHTHHKCLFFAQLFEFIYFLNFFYFFYFHLFVVCRINWFSALNREFFFFTRSRFVRISQRAPHTRYFSFSFFSANCRLWLICCWAVVAPAHTYTHTLTRDESRIFTLITLFAHFFSSFASSFAQFNFTWTQMIQHTAHIQLQMHSWWQLK